MPQFAAQIPHSLIPRTFWRWISVGSKNILHLYNWKAILAFHFFILGDRRNSIDKEINVNEYRIPRAINFVYDPKKINWQDNYKIS